MKFLKLILISVFMLKSMFSMNINFIGNMPAYVPSETESDLSEIILEETKIFTENDFENPPYVVNEKKRGEIVTDLLTRGDGGYIVSSGELQEFVRRAEDNFLLKPRRKVLSSKVIDSYFELLKNTAFRDAADERLRNIKFVVGLNRPRSLSFRKNFLLYKELRTYRQDFFDAKVFGFFWDYQWKNKTTNKKVSYKEVLNFYNQFKRYNSDKAEEFRIKNEKTSRGAIVPYRSLRELIKKNESTKGFIKQVRKEVENSVVYLFITDPDTKNFNGCFDSYFQIAQKHDNPDVMTTGYIFSSEEPMISLASILDMKVRIATAELIPVAVYFPEPSLCNLVLGDEVESKESFEEFTPGGKVSKRYYLMPGESKNLIGSTSKTRKDPRLIFPKGRKLLTSTPPRALENKKGGKFIFKGRYNFETKKVERWTFSDLRNISSNFAQSHANTRGWSTNFIDALKLDNIPYKGKNLNKKNTRDLVISLLSRLFNSYNPIYLAKENKKTLFRIINNYDFFVSKDEIDKYDIQKKRLDVLSYADKINSREKLLSVLSVAIKNYDVELIRQAAENSGREIASFLNKYFDFSEQSSLEEQFGSMKITKN
jgi:uncharacterized protein YktA (UPF0223 family)